MNILPFALFKPVHRLEGLKSDDYKRLDLRLVSRHHDLLRVTLGKIKPQATDVHIIKPVTIHEAF